MCRRFLHRCVPYAAVQELDEPVLHMDFRARRNAIARLRLVRLPFEGNEATVPIKLIRY
jgi:hypothetical protein